MPFVVVVVVCLFFECMYLLIVKRLLSVTPVLRTVLHIEPIGHVVGTLEEVDGWTLPYMAYECACRPDTGSSFLSPLSPPMPSQPPSRAANCIRGHFLSCAVGWAICHVTVPCPSGFTRPARSARADVIN
jgi:hypothetical protein